MTPLIQANCQFDAGSILSTDLSTPQNLRFSLRHDSNAHFAQWFYFQLHNIRDQRLGLNLENLDRSAYPAAWDGYNVCASYDNKNWFRIPSRYAANNLSWHITPQANSIYFAYFEPYSYDRHLALIGLSNQSDHAQHLVLGSSIQGRNLDLLIIGNPKAKRKIWLIARQHPGETMAEWFMEGLIQRLLNPQDAISNALLQQCVFYLLPNMNPDGAYLGNLRTNAAGANLNREWLAPTLERSPEVLYVRQHILATGADMFFDIHGDETIPYVFTAGCEDNPNYSQQQLALATKFSQAFLMASPDYQTQYGYVKNQFNQETPSLATNWVGNQFNCLALTLEMPFKDNANLPNSHSGWNGYRSSLLGQSLLNAIYITLQDFKA